MAEPTLNEITNVVADPERGSGTPAVLLDNRNMIANLNQNARFKAENDWRKYNLFLGNLKDTYKDLGDIASLEVATQDRDELKKRMGEIFEGIASDPKSFFSGGPNFSKINEQIVKLKSDATESKMNRAYDFAHREYINRNPELNTPDNTGTIENFWQQPLGKRKAYMLKMPTIFDVAGYSQGVMDNPFVSQPFAEAKSVGPDGGAGNEFIREVSGVKYDRSKYMQAWNAGLSTAQDKYGHSIRTWAQQQYNALPEEQKKKYGTVEDFWNDLGKMTFNSDKDIVSVLKDNLKANPAAYKPQELAIQKERNSIAWSRLNEVDKPKADAQIERWHNLSKGSEDQKANAISFAHNLYGQLQSIADKNGVITPDKMRQMTAEQLKYLGVMGPTVKDADGTTRSAGLQPLNLPEGSVLQLDKGKVWVMSGAKKIEDGTPEGKWEGKWDKTKTTTFSNIATNRLNEELKTAGAKELSNYAPIDDGEDGPPEGGEGDGGFDTSGLVPRVHGGKTYYVNPKTRKVYDSKGKELK